MALDFDSVGATAERTQCYDWRDVALYALSLGAGTDDLPFVVDDPPPKVLPTYGVLPAFEPALDVMRRTGGDLLQLLHTAQRTELLAPLPPGGELRTTATLRGLWDMKIGAMALVDTESFVDGTLHARTTWELLLRGEGGFGGERPPRRRRVRIDDDAEPLFSVNVPTRRDQALLYRLNGDINPIHSNPAVAKLAGFDRPILHGLCSYGIGARIALGQLLDDDPARFRSFEARFNAPVMPGDTLTVRGYALDSGTGGESGGASGGASGEKAAAIRVSIAESGQEAVGSGRLQYV